MVLNGVLKYHWQYHWSLLISLIWYWMVFLYTIERIAKKCFNTEWSNGTYWVIFSNTIENTTKVWFIIEQYVYILLIESFDFIIEWSNGTEWYSQIPLKIPLKSHLLLHSMFYYHWENNWNKILSLNDLIYNWKECSNTVASTIDAWFYHWMVQWYWMVLQITAENTIESYWNTIGWSNGTEWYSMVFNAIPLALFCQGHW